MRYCINCGREISDAAKVCPYCGTALAPQQAAPAAAPVPPVAPETPVRTAAPYVQQNYEQPTAYAPQPNYEQPAAYAPQPGPAYAQPQINVMTSAPITEESLPAHLRPLSPWAYFGLMLLYSVPIVGFVFLIVFSFSKGNINRRNFTRSFWIPLVIAVIVFIILVVVAGGVDSIGKLF